MDSRVSSARQDLHEVPRRPARLQAVCLTMGAFVKYLDNPPQVCNVSYMYPMFDHLLHVLRSCCPSVSLKQQVRSSYAGARRKRVGGGGSLVGFIREQRACSDGARLTIMPYTG